MRKSLDWSLFFSGIDFGEGPFDGLSEFVRKKATEGDDEVDDFGVHVGEIQKGPEFL